MSAPFHSMGHWMGSQTEIEKGNYNSILDMWNACECQHIVYVHVLFIKPNLGRFPHAMQHIHE
jgi:hypothetical protein